MNKICVVGSKLKEFSNNKSVFTTKEFINLLQLESNMLDGINQYNVHLGQGLDDKARAYIFNKIIEEELQNRFVFSGIDQHTKRATGQMTHKAKQSNTLISVPEKISDGNYKSYLMIDENCAEFSDHLTGQHIQAMVLVEAARQMVNAVVEEHMLDADKKEKVGFVLNTFNSEFHHYVFPFEVILTYKVKKIRKMPTGDLMATAVISVIQNDHVCMQAELKHSVIDKNFLNDKESEMAVKSLMKMKDTKKITNTLVLVAA